MSHHVVCLFRHIRQYSSHLPDMAAAVYYQAVLFSPYFSLLPSMRKCVRDAQYAVWRVYEGRTCCLRRVVVCGASESDCSKVGWIGWQQAGGRAFQDWKHKAQKPVHAYVTLNLQECRLRHSHELEDTIILHLCHGSRPSILHDIQLIRSSDHFTTSTHHLISFYAFRMRQQREDQQPAL